MDFRILIAFLGILSCSFSADYSTVEYKQFSDPNSVESDTQFKPLSESDEKRNSDSQSDSGLPIQLEEEITNFLQSEVIPILQEALFEKGGLEKLPESLLLEFQVEIGVSPCHPQLLSDSVGKLFDAWFNRNQLEPYLKMYENLLSFTELNFKDLAKSALAAKSKLASYFKKAQIENKRLGLNPSVNQESLNVKIPQSMSLNTKVLAYQSQFLRIPGNQIHESSLLIYYLNEVRRELHDPIAIATKCKKNLNCVLQEFQVNNASKILQLHKTSGIWFLGYEQSDLMEYEKILNKYPTLFHPARKFYKLRTVQIPQNPEERTNEYRSDLELIWMWSVDQIKQDLEQRLEEFRKFCPQIQSELILLALLEERQKVFIHEVGHAVSSKFLHDNDGNWNSMGKKWINIGWETETKAAGVPYDCAGVNFSLLQPKSPCEVNFLRLSPGDLVYQKYGFLTQYAGVNPEEDFAETLAHYITGTPEFLSNTKHVKMKARLDLIEEIFAKK